MRGVITSLVTPFDGDGLDKKRFSELICSQIEQGVAGLLVGGTTGEAPTLELEEYEELVHTAAEATQRKVPLLVSIGESATKRSLIKMEMATEAGADALLLAAPAYNKPTQEGLYLHFKTIATRTKLPLFLYNHPGRTGVDIQIETLLRLAEIDSIIGIKESSGKIQTATDMLYHLPDDFIVLSGDDHLTLPLIALGAKGVISVLSNLMPKEMVAFTDAALKGDFETARLLQKELYPFFKACTYETNPVPIKTMMALLGLIKEKCRLPLAPLSDDNRTRLEALLRISVYES